MTDKKPIDYSHGKIYGIRSRSSDLLYIGSTIQPLNKRLASHVGDYKRWLDGNYHYVSSFKLIELGEFYIELIEEVNCSSKEQLLAHEGRHIRNIECVNKYIPGRTAQEQKELAREYRQVPEHKEIARKRDSEYRQVPEHKEFAKERDSKYYQDNKLYRIERADDYYKANTERIHARNNQVIVCECGETYTRTNRAQHYKSKKHIAS